MTSTVTLYETNSDLLVVARGDQAWNWGPATPDMEGKFAEDARTWVAGDWQPGEVNGQTPTHIDDDLTAVAERSAEGVLRLLVDAERIGGAARVYLACGCAVCGNQPVDLPGESFHEWGEDPDTEEPRILCGNCWERYGTRADGTPAS